MYNFISGQYQILRVQSSPSVPASTASPGVTAVSNATQIVQSTVTPAEVVRTQSQTSAPETTGGGAGGGTAGMGTQMAPTQSPQKTKSK